VSGLFKRTPKSPKHIPTPGMVDPTVEIIQPGGPFPYGDVILTDGAGGYTIAPTLRPYFVSFRIPSKIEAGESVDCEHQGVSTAVVGFPVPLPLNLIAISVALDLPIDQGAVYHVEILRDLTDVIGRLRITPADKKCAVRRDLSVPVQEGSELSARVVHTSGKRLSTFSTGIVVVELEA